MRLHGRTGRQMPEINVTSFSDIAFLLIIFFILTTSFVKPAGDRLTIPSGTTDPARKEQNKLTIAMSGETIRYGPQGQAVDVDTLRGLLLREHLETRPEADRIVVVQSDPTVPYEQYYQVVMAINAAGGVLGLIEEEGAAGARDGGAAGGPAGGPT